MQKFLIHALAAVSITAFAAQTSAEEARIPAGVFTNVQTTDQYLARDTLIGAKVHGPDGKIIGDIEDLIINEYNLVTGVVMGTGGFMGIAEKKVGVNVQALKFADKDGKTEISLPEATPEVLAAVEAYQRNTPKKSLVERAMEKTQELTDKASATAKSAAEGAKPALDSAAEKSIEAYEKAKEAAKPALEAAKEAVNSAVDKASKAIDDATAPATPAPEAPKP
ncbi:MAG: PRC-barrel domain-containing protein [Hyphomicrobium sp.]